MTIETCSKHNYSGTGFCPDCIIEIRNGGNKTDRENLEWLVHLAWKESIISISKGRELLGFEYMEEMREWLNKMEEGK